MPGPRTPAPERNRYAFQPLLDAIDRDDQSVKVRLGLDVRQVANYQATGLSERRADELATRAGFHPGSIWPDWLSDLEVECAERTCDERFVPRRKGHRFCSSRCFHRTYGREFQRRKYATDPQFREHKKARAVQYRAAAGRALVVKQRAWKARNLEAQKAYRRAYYAANRERILAKQRDYDRRKRDAA